MNKLLFSTSPIFLHISLAVLRICSAALILTHGWSKLADYSSNIETFRDPIGLGSALSLQLAIFAEFFCAILLMVGFLTRLSLIPLIFTMAVAAFIVHADDPFSTMEKSLLFLLIFIFQFFAGPGRYSIDHQIKNKRRY